jgi:ribosomal protein L10
VPPLNMANRPRDPNQLAKLIVDIATGDAEDSVSPAKRTPAPQRKAGIKGGKARAKSLTPAERAEIAQIAAKARWKKN